MQTCSGIRYDSETGFPSLCVSPNECHVVGGEMRVSGYDGQFVSLRLGDEKTIEGIPMVKGKMRNTFAVVGAYGQPLDAVVAHFPPDGRRPTGLQPEFANPNFDGDFPPPGDTEEQIVPAVEYCASRPVGEPVRRGTQPEQGVRIQQHSHEEYSSKSASGASKSLDMRVIRPGRPPNRRLFFGGWSRLSPTTGSCPRITTIASPANVRSISRERCVLA